MKLSKKIILLLLLPCLSCFSLINQVLAQEEFEEEALFRFEEYVVSASKRLQRIEEAPATITVITAEDIRQSGLTSIPEILRQVAGLDVVTLTAFDTQVAIRGLYGPAANMNVFNKILVLINGRSVYEDPFGGTIWEALPIQLEDIERIEIIKGPGSVLYGANALTGVINIITKSPDESEGGVFSVTDGWFNGSGEINHYIRSLIYGGKIKDFGYRLSGGWESVSRLEEHDKDSEKIGKFLGLFNYKINESSEATLEGGISDGKGEIFVNFPGFLAESQKGYVKANYNYQELKTQVFWRHETFDVPFYAFLGPSPLISLVGLDEFISGSYYTYDIELQQSIKLAEIHTIMGGLNYRYFTLSSNYTEQKGLNTYAGFLQYEIKPLPSIIFNLGVRVDHQNYIGTNVSPRGSLIFTPLKGHIIC
ncbi:MAG: TonB-dependent receptor, partial [Deltaproteobacteria bacterium]